MNLGADAAYARDCTIEYAALATSVIPVDTAVSVRAFEIGAACDVRVPLVDTIIAASAQVLNARLLHRDRHFNSIPAGLVEMEELELTIKG